MFDKLFERDHVIAKHRNGPLATEREDFLRHLEAKKYARRVIRETAITLMVVVRRMGVVSPRTITSNSCVAISADRHRGVKVR